MALIEISEQVRMATALRKAYEELELQVEARTTELSKAVAILEAQITERQRAEEALRESQTRLKGIISTATDAIITVDANQHIILFNATAERVFQYQADEVIGQPLNLLLPERFRELHTRQVQYFGQTGVTARRMGVMPGELWGRRADGEEFPIEAMISQVEISRQKSYPVILRDITERKRIEAEKERLFQEVSQQREQLRALARQLARVQEAERKELARELHDRAGQNLTALDLTLNLIWAQLAETPGGRPHPGPTGRFVGVGGGDG
jgi:PAS domain S-box-containing protein